MAKIALRRKARNASSKAPKRLNVRYRCKDGLEPRVRLWMLRILVPLGPHLDSMDKFSCSRRSLEEGLGIPVKLADEDEEDFERRNTFWKRIRIPLRKLQNVRRMATVSPKDSSKIWNILENLSGGMTIQSSYWDFQSSWTPNNF
ncbi:MAG: hypothetical protein ABIN69_18770 [Aestuariivirga sp.]